MSLITNLKGKVTPPTDAERLARAQMAADAAWSAYQALCPGAIDGDPKAVQERDTAFQAWEKASRENEHLRVAVVQAAALRDARAREAREAELAKAWEQTARALAARDRSTLALAEALGDVATHYRAAIAATALVQRNMPRGTNADPHGSLLADGMVEDAIVLELARLQVPLGSSRARMVFIGDPREVTQLTQIFESASAYVLQGKGKGTVQALPAPEAEPYVAAPIPKLAPTDDALPAGVTMRVSAPRKPGERRA